MYQTLDQSYTRHKLHFLGACFKMYAYKSYRSQAKKQIFSQEREDKALIQPIYMFVGTEMRTFHLIMHCYCS